eukprot:s644_g15.t2
MSQCSVGGCVRLSFDAQRGAFEHTDTAAHVLLDVFLLFIEEPRVQKSVSFKRLVKFRHPRALGHVKLISYGATHFLYRSVPPKDIVLDIAQVAGNNGLKLPREFGLLIKQSLYFDRYTKLLAPDLNMMSDERIANFGQDCRLESPSWVAPIAQFVDEQCIIFEDQEENKLEYTECHNEFRQLIDNLLAAHLLELDVSNEQFEQFCQTSLSTNSTLHRVLVEQLLAVDDFLIFKAMMTKRNADLYREAQRRVDAGQLDEEDFHETTVVDDDEASLVADEWKLYEDQLFQALDESQKADDELARQRQKEEEELERALVLSLQMEEERMHGLAGEAAASPSSSSAAGQDAAPPPPAPPPPSEAASAAPAEGAAAPAAAVPATAALSASSLGPLRPVLPRVMRVGPMAGSRPGTAASVSPEHERARAEIAALAQQGPVEEASVPPPPPPEAQPQPSEADRKARAEHLQRQRQLLVEKRNKERQKQLDAAKGSGNARVVKAVDAANAGGSATGKNLVAELTAPSAGGEAVAETANAAAQMRQALAAQLKQTLRTPV